MVYTTSIRYIILCAVSSIVEEKAIQPCFEHSSIEIERDDDDELLYNFFILMCVLMCYTCN